MKFIDRLRAAWRVFTYEHPIVARGMPLSVLEPITWYRGEGASWQEIVTEVRMDDEATAQLGSPINITTQS